MSLETRPGARIRRNPDSVEIALTRFVETDRETVWTMLTDPDRLAAAHAEFEERTGGGVGGDDWLAPLLDAEFVPPTDLPWPEYVETPRGREWSLPTPREEVGFGEELTD